MILKWAVTNGPWLFTVLAVDILPSYVGNLTSHYKDSYEPTSIVEYIKGFLDVQLVSIGN